MHPQNVKLEILPLYFGAIYFLAFLCLVVVMALGILGDIPMYKFFRDPSRVAGISPFIGVISNLGVLLWGATASICLFCWALLRHQKNDMGFSTYFGYSGFLTILLLLDDLFCFHDWIIPVKTPVSGDIIFIVYGGMVVFGGIFFKRCILDTKYHMILIAFGFFGLSLTVDAFQGDFQKVLGNKRIFFEDGLKFFGIVSWIGYYSYSCFIKINALLSERE